MLGTDWQRDKRAINTYIKTDKVKGIERKDCLHIRSSNTYTILLPTLYYISLYFKISTEILGGIHLPFISLRHSHKQSSTFRFRDIY